MNMKRRKMKIDTVLTKFPMLFPCCHQVLLWDFAILAFRRSGKGNSASTEFLGLHHSTWAELLFHSQEALAARKWRE